MVVGCQVISGVNLKGDFNVENSTLFEQDDSMDLDDKGEFSCIYFKSFQGHKQLYTTVWELQAFFCNPVLLLEGERLSKFQDVCTSSSLCLTSGISIDL